MGTLRKNSAKVLHSGRRDMCEGWGSWQREMRGKTSTYRTVIYFNLLLLGKLKSLRIYNSFLGLYLSLLT